MSQLQVDKLFSENPSGSTENILLNDDGTTNLKGNTTVTGTCTATSFAGSGASLTGISSPGSFRNLLYNGAMVICQRGTSSTGLTSGGYKVADRWKHTFSDAGTWSVEQVEDAPEGFVHSIKIKCTTQATFGASGRVYIEQLLESRDQQHYKYGTSNAVSLTLSFWIKSSRTGTFNAGFVNQGARSGSPSGTEIADRATSQLVTISSANTWEKKTITFAGDTGAYIRNNRHKGVGLRLTFNSGSNYTGGSAQSWGTNTSANTYTGTLGLGTATNDDLFLTGVQLEIGTSATDFEYRSLGEELNRCYRYCYVINGDNGIITGTPSFTFNSSSFGHNFTFPQEFRETPNFNASATSMRFVGGDDSGERNVNQLGVWGTGCKQAMSLTQGSSSGGTAGYGGSFQFTENGGYIQFDAEL